MNNIKDLMKYFRIDKKYPQEELKIPQYKYAGQVQKFSERIFNSCREKEWVRLVKDQTNSWEGKTKGEGIFL